jgi:uncharacterized membrane protein (UPF0127 family)
MYEHPDFRKRLSALALEPGVYLMKDAEGTIINIENMQPQTENNHCAKVPARYALEMNLGWFAQRGIKPGAKLKGIDKAPRPQ